jgi:hypothetical protein
MGSLRKARHDARLRPSSLSGDLVVGRRTRCQDWLIAARSRSSVTGPRSVSQAYLRKIDQIKRRHVRPSACCSRHSIDRGLKTSWPIIEYWRRQRTPSPIDCPCRKLIAHPRSATNARALFGTLSRVSWSSSSESCVAIGGDVETYRDRRRPPPDRQRHSRSPRCPPSRGHRHRIRRRLGAAPRPARDAASSRAGGPS